MRLLPRERSKGGGIHADGERSFSVTRRDIRPDIEGENSGRTGGRKCRFCKTVTPYRYYRITVRDLNIMDATNNTTDSAAERFAEKASHAIELAVLEDLRRPRTVPFGSLSPTGLIKRELPTAKRFAVLRRDDYRCRLCGACADDGVRLEVDHIIPIARGGSNEYSNLWTLCFDCNRGKAANSVDL